jgi:hypothetical protein
MCGKIRVKSSEKITLARFDAFNTDRGGLPVEFEGSFGRYMLAVRDYERGSARRIEVTHGKFLAGFVEELIIGDRYVESGKYGWIGVLNYPEICRELELRGLGRYGVTTASERYLRDLDKPETLGKYMNYAVLLRYAAEKADAGNTEPDNVMKTLLNPSALNYEGDPHVLSRMLEFVSVVSPPSTRWRLTEIGHEETQKQLLACKPFERTGLGRRFTMNGWEATPHEGDETDRASPILKRRENYKLCRNWIKLAERLSCLPR